MKRSYMLFAGICLTAAQVLSQIPNNSFESWTSTDPDSWETNNTNSHSNIISVTKISTAKTGSSAMKLATWSYQGFVFPPIAICPHSNSYFKYSGTPSMITGWYMANLQGGDKMVVTGALRKGSSTIGGGISYITSNTTVYQQFQVPLTYTSQQLSDSATVMVTIMSANGGGTNLNPASHIVVDDIQFANGTPTSIKEEGMAQTLRIAQDPQNGITRIEYDLSNAGPVNVSIRDLQGKLVREILSAHQEAGRYRIDEETGYLEPSVYVLRLETGGGVAVCKLLKAKN